MKLNHILKYPILILILLCLISRLPILLSPNLMLDGDECIIALMTKHFSEGKGIPIFFYGQSYGFSLLEVATIQSFSWIIGLSTVTIKLSMLFLWTIGIIFFYKTLKQIEFGSNKLAALLITLLFIFSPVWAIWSMKARGGYITAFVLSSVITYLTVHNKWQKTIYLPIIIGVLLSIVFQSQPLWLAGLIPVIVYYLSKNKWFYKTALSAFGLAVGMSLFYLLKAGSSIYWSPQVFNFSALNLEAISLLPIQIYQNFTGSYAYSLFKEPNIIVQLLAIIYIIIFISTLTTGLFFLIKRKYINPWLYVFSISIIATISYLPVTTNYNTRYLLPLFGFVLPTVYVLLIHINKTKIVNFGLVSIILLGTFSMYTFKNYDFEEKTLIKTLLKELKSKNIKYLYCEGGMLQWKIMFYSNEKIITRYKNSTDRYPEYIHKVDSAFNYGADNVGLLKISNNRYTIYKNPSRDLLIERGFNFNKIKGIEDYKRIILNTPIWVEDIRIKAKERGISLDSMIYLDAKYMTKQNPQTQ